MVHLRCGGQRHTIGPLRRKTWANDTSGSKEGRKSSRIRGDATVNSSRTFATNEALLASRAANRTVSPADKTTAREESKVEML